MNATGSILDADMATIGRWLRNALAWWLDELRTMLPQRLSRSGKVPDSYLELTHDAGLRVMIGNELRPFEEADGMGVALPLRINSVLALSRRIDMPVLSRADQMRLMQMDAERLFPMQASALLLATGRTEREGDGRKLAVPIWAVPVSTVEPALTRLRELDREPTRLLVWQEGLADLADFTPAAISAGLVADRRPKRVAWWAVVALLFAVNLGLLVWRDVQELERLRGLIDAQTPAVSAARVIAGRIEKSQSLAAGLARQRQGSDPFDALDSVVTALPQQAWVQRLNWDGRSIRLTGYKRPDADVIGALRKSGRFAAVRSANTEAVAEVPTGQPFDISARMIAPAR